MMGLRRLTAVAVSSSFVIHPHTDLQHLQQAHPQSQQAVALESTNSQPLAQLLSENNHGRSNPRTNLR